MTTDFETWAMRGLVAALGGWVTYLVRREVLNRDRRLKENRDELERTKTKFTHSMEQMSERFSASIDQLNMTVSSLAGAISDFRTLVAREYATREELREAEEYFRKTLEQCQNNCLLKR